MSITWNPISPTPSLSGTISCIGGVTTEWLSCLKGEVITGHISSTHTNQNYCVSVVHTISPAAPSDLIIYDNVATGGIDVSGTVLNVLLTPINIDLNTIDNNQLSVAVLSPKVPGEILTHYTPLPTPSESFTITTTVTWNHDVNIDTVYVQNWILTIYNSWAADRAAVLSLV